MAKYKVGIKLEILKVRSEADLEAVGSIVEITGIQGDTYLIEWIKASNESFTVYDRADIDYLDTAATPIDDLGKALFDGTK